MRNEFQGKWLRRKEGGHRVEDKVYVRSIVNDPKRASERGVLVDRMRGHEIPPELQGLDGADEIGYY